MKNIFRSVRIGLYLLTVICLVGLLAAVIGRKFDLLIDSGWILAIGLSILQIQTIAFAERLWDLLSEKRQR